VLIRAVAFLLLAVFPLADVRLNVTCRDSDSIYIPTNLAGTYFQVTNDVWGDPKSEHVQCVSGGNGGLGWQWSKPRFTYAPYFPHISLNVSQITPKRVTEISRLQVIASLVIAASGTYNLAFDVWITADLNGIQVTDEVMVWLLWTNRTLTRVPITTTDGFNNYGYMTYMDRWRFHAFFLLANTIPFVVDLKRLLTFAGIDGYIRELSLGNEIFSGVGRTKIYAINIIMDQLTVGNSGACYVPSCANIFNP
jgi:hypothetical protein